MTIYLKALTRDGLRREVATPFTFPGGEPHLKDIADLPAGTTWIADVRGANSHDLVTAAMFADVARDLGNDFVLFLPYLPAARADRGVPLGVRAYAFLLDSMDPEQIISIDVHSPVAGRWTPSLRELSAVPLIKRALADTGHKYDAVIAPDKGARRRAEEIALELDLDLYVADKKRVFETGKITQIEIEPLPRTGRYLVVDDICDGGRTFRELAKAIDLPRYQLGLWVTHGIFSGEANLLRNNYLEIYTTDSHSGHNRLGCATTVIPTESYMLQNVKGFW